MKIALNDISEKIRAQRPFDALLMKRGKTEFELWNQSQCYDYTYLNKKSVCWSQCCSIVD